MELNKNYESIKIRVADGDKPPVENDLYGTTNGLGENKKMYKIVRILNVEEVKSELGTPWVEYECEVKELNN